MKDLKLFSINRALIFSGLKLMLFCYFFGAIFIGCAEAGWWLDAKRNFLDRTTPALTTNRDAGNWVFSFVCRKKSGIFLINISTSSFRTYVSSSSIPVEIRTGEKNVKLNMRVLSNIYSKNIELRTSSEDSIFVKSIILDLINIQGYLIISFGNDFVKFGGNDSNPVIFDDFIENCDT